MSDKFLNLSGLSYFWDKIKTYVSGELPVQATDTTLGTVKLNPSESVTLNADGQLDVGGRLGQMQTGTGIYNPKSISPQAVGDGSFLLTEGSGTSLGSKSLAVSTGTNVTCRSAAANSTVYRVTNTYENRITCSMLRIAGGVAALDEITAKEGKYANVVSVQINGADFTPDSSANNTAQANDIVITLDATVNPDSAITSVRLYPAELGYSTLFVGQGCASNGGASVVVGQKVINHAGNANALVGASIYNQGNGNSIFGRLHISRKNRWFMAGTGHDNTNGKAEVGAAFGQYSEISSDTEFVVGKGTNQTTRRNLFEIKSDGRAKSSGTPTDSDDLATKGYVDSAIGGGGVTFSEYGNADFTYQKEYDTDGTTVLYECVAYSTAAGNANEPRATKYGRIVNLTGAFKNVNVRGSNATFTMGKVPTGCEPIRDEYVRVQGSAQYSYLLNIKTDGTMTCSRYANGSSAIAVPANAWLNINAVYISAQ